MKCTVEEEQTLANKDDQQSHSPASAAVLAAYPVIGLRNSQRIKLGLVGSGSRGMHWLEGTVIAWLVVRTTLFIMGSDRGARVARVTAKRSGKSGRDNEIETSANQSQAKHWSTNTRTTTIQFPS